MATFQVSLLVEIDTDEDAEDIRSDLLNAVQDQLKNNPDQFLVKYLDEQIESDWEVIEEHGGACDWEIDSIHPSFDPVFRNET